MQSQQYPLRNQIYGTILTKVVSKYKTRSESPLYITQQSI